jgi:transposase
MPRKYTLEFKNEAVRLVTEQGYSQNKAAKALGIPSKNVNRWVKEATNKDAVDKKVQPTEQEEINRLRKENARLKMEHEILKKAAAFFASEKF